VAKATTRAAPFHATPKAWEHLAVDLAGPSAEGILLDDDPGPLTELPDGIERVRKA
jgi:hypothetical protein